MGDVNFPSRTFGLVSIAFDYDLTIMFTSWFVVCKEWHIWMTFPWRGSRAWLVWPGAFSVTRAIFSDMKMRWKCFLWCYGRGGGPAGTYVLRWGKKNGMQVCKPSPHNTRAMIFGDMRLSVRSNRRDLWATLHLNVHLPQLSQKSETGVGGRESPSEVTEPDMLRTVFFFLSISTDFNMVYVCKRRPPYRL